MSQNQSCPCCGTKGCGCGDKPRPAGECCCGKTCQCNPCKCGPECGCPAAQKK